MYVSLSVLLLTGLSLLTFLPLWQQKTRAWHTIVESILTGFGVLLHLAVPVMLWWQTAGLEKDAADWVWDMLTTYLRYGLGILCTVLVLTVGAAMTALWDKKYRTTTWRTIRSLCSLASSLVLVALAGFFAAMSVTDLLPLDWYIRLLGIAGALVLRGMFLAEIFVEQVLQKRGKTSGRTGKK